MHNKHTTIFKKAREARAREARKGGWYGWKPLSSSNFSIRAFRAQPLIETRQMAPRLAIRGNGISVNSTRPPYTTTTTTTNDNDNDNDNDITQ